MMIAPTILSATAKDCGTALLEWSPVSGAERYNINVGGLTVRQVIGTKTRAAVVGLAASATASITVSARDADGNVSDPSTAALVAIPAAQSSLYSVSAARLVGKGQALYRSQTSFTTRRVIFCGTFLRIIDSPSTVRDMALPDLAATFSVDAAYIPWGQFSSMAMPAIDTVILQYHVAGLIFYLEMTIGASSLTVVSANSYGDSHSWPGDCLALVGGAFIGVHTQGYDYTNPTPWFCVHRSAAGAWSTYQFGNRFTTALAGSNVSLVQHPLDASIWMISSYDASETIFASRLSNTGTALVELENGILFRSNSGYYPWPHGENPWVVARPNAARGTIVVAYTMNDSPLVFSTKMNLATSYAGFYGQGLGSETQLELLDQVLGAQVAFCEITKQTIPYAQTGDGKTFFPQLPDRFERVSPGWDFYCENGGIVLAECPIDATDLTRVKIFSRVYTAGAWGPQAELGVKDVQDLGIVTALAGVASFETTDATARLATITAPAGSPPPAPPPTGQACANPVFGVPRYANRKWVSVEITCSTPGAVIHYTTNGSTPTSGSPGGPSPFQAAHLVRGQTVKAIGIATGYTDSAVVSRAV